VIEQISNLLRMVKHIQCSGNLLQKFTFGNPVVRSSDTSNHRAAKIKLLQMFHIALDKTTINI